MPITTAVGILGSGFLIIDGVGSTTDLSNSLLTCILSDAAVPLIMFVPLAIAGTLSASRLVANVDVTPSKPGENKDIG